VGHLTPSELREWHEAGGGSERDRVVGHLAGCDACGARFGVVIQAVALATARHVLGRGYRACRRAASGRAWPIPAFAFGRAPAILLIAAAAALVRVDNPAVAPETAIRGTSLQPVSPIGAVAPPIVFRWASPVDVARFVVTIADGQRVLVVLETRTQAVPLPDARLEDLEPGETYWWSVSAIAEDGSEIMRAPPRPFAVARRPR
jgi:hypothetical protein